MPLMHATAVDAALVKVAHSQSLFRMADDELPGAALLFKTVMMPQTGE
jgi:hypothetical protein